MKKSKNRLIDNNNFLKVFSLLMASLIWYLVVTTDGQNITVKVKDVPINFDEISSSVLGKIGLNPINLDEETTVDVLISGKREEVGSIGKEDIRISPDVTDVNLAGVYDISLVPDNNQNIGFKIESISPKKLSIQFDKIVSKKLRVEPAISGLSVPEGYMLEAPSSSPNEIIVSGPELDVSRVDRVITRLELSKPLEKSFSAKTKPVLLDKEGNEISSKYITVNYPELTVTIPVLKVQKVPFRVKFKNVPEAFPIEELDYEFSEDSITVAVPTSLAKSIKEIDLGYIDLRELPEKSSFKFDVELPDGFINVQGTKSVICSVDTRNMKSASLVIRDIRPIKVPMNYDVSVETNSLEVEFFGRGEDIDKLIPRDVDAVIDFSERKIGKGMSQVPVKIVVPGEMVFAVDSHKAVVNVREK